MLDFNKEDFLLRPNVLEELNALRGVEGDSLKLSKHSLLKGYLVQERTALVEQLKLREKALKKFSQGENFLFTKLGLEQSTRETLSKYKAKRLMGKGESVVDLCCGIGGDSFFLKQKVIGVDWDRATLKYYMHNLKALKKEAYGVLADVGTCNIRAEIALLDPARRKESAREKNWGTSNLSPSLECIEQIISHYGNVALKLGPGTMLPDSLLEHEIEFLGIKDECLELIVWTGELGRSGCVRGTEVVTGKSYSMDRLEIEGLYDSVESPGSYIYEPIKVMVRSHLFGLLAKENNLWQLDPRIAYLSGNQVIDSPLLKGYRVIEEIPLNLKALKKVIRKREIGILEIKKRGVSIVPEKLRQELKPVGEMSAVLILTRVNNKKVAFLTEPI